MDTRENVSDVINVKLAMDNLVLTALELPDMPHSRMLKKMIDTVFAGGRLKPTYLPLDDGLDSYELEDGNWTGSLGSLQRGEADFAFPPIVMDYPKSQVAGFFKLYIYSNVRILSKRVTRSGISDMLDPIIFANYQIWFLLVLSTMVAGFCSHVMNVILGSEGQYGLFYQIFKYASSFSFQNPDKDEKHYNQRILRTVFWIAVILLNTIIGAYITLNLIVEDKSDLIDRLDDLLKKPKFEVFMPNLMGIYDAVRAGQTEDFRKLSRRITYHKDINGEEREFCGGNDATSRIYGGKAVIINNEELILQCHQFHCPKYGGIRLHLSKGVIMQVLLGLPYSKSIEQELKIRLSFVSKILQESGMINNMLQMIKSPMPSCLEDRDLDTTNVNSASSLTLEGISKCFAFLLLGLIASAVVFLGECAINVIRGRFKTAVRIQSA